MARRKEAESSFDVPLFDPGRVPDAEPEGAVAAGRTSPASANGTRSLPLTVAQLARGIRDVLDMCFPDVWVVGQVSGLKRAASGHLYFDLKDESACVSCVMWESDALRLRAPVEDGMEAVCRGRVSFYARSGRCQLYVTQVEPRGRGALEVRFRQLKERLEKEGLFAAARKKPLPGFPTTVGVVTSPTGAAIRDILHVLGRRAPWLRVLVYPVAVQGEGAAEEIARAVRDVDRWLFGQVDVLIVGRGGGSVEDLWAFNEEAVARAIAGCRIPVVSAVGHETDFSISDFVADVRAPTPSAAAEIIVPDRRELLQRVATDAGRLQRAIDHALTSERNRWRLVAQHRFFKYPEEIAGLRSAALDDLSGRMGLAQGQAMEEHRGRLHDMERRLPAVRPAARLAAQRGRLAEASVRHEAAARRIVERAAATAEQLGRRLEALGPLAVLRRGYSITVSLRTGHAVRAAADTAESDLLETTVSNRDRIRSRVVEQQEPAADPRRAGTGADEGDGNGA